MDEQTKEKQTANDTGEGNKPSSTPLIDETNKAAQRMEEATEAQRIENDRTEQLIMHKRLGGKSEGGQAPVEKKEIDNKEYAENILAGGLNVKKE